MRIRTIKPDFWRDGITGEMEPRAALFFVGMWQVADDDGRFEWNPRLIRADLDPFDTKFGGPEGITGLLEQLASAGRLVRYHVDGRTYGHIPSFGRHQRINRKTDSRLPEPPSALTEGSVSDDGGLTAGREGKGREGKGHAVREERVSAPPISSLPRWPNVVETTHPAVWSLWLTLRAKGMDLSIPKSREARDAIEADVRRLGMEAAADECVRVNGDREDIGNLAFFVDALRKASVPEAPVPGPEPVPMHLLPAVEFEN